MKTRFKRIALLAPLMLMGCVEVNKPKPLHTTPVDSIKPPIVVPPSMRPDNMKAWRMIAHALKFDAKTMALFIQRRSLFSDISKEVMANSYNDSEIYTLIQKNNGKAKRTSNSQRPYQFYYTQKLDNGILFVLFTSRSNIDYIELNPIIKRVGSTSDYKKAYSISFDISGHEELKRDTTTLTIFSDNSKTYVESGHAVNLPPSHSTSIFKVYAIVGRRLPQSNYNESSIDPVIREACNREKYKQQCYERYRHAEK